MGAAATSAKLRNWGCGSARARPAKAERVKLVECMVGSVFVNECVYEKVGDQGKVSEY